MSLIVMGPRASSPTQVTSPEQDCGALTWVGTTAPSGTITKKYIWSRVGKVVTLSFRIESTVAGLLVTAVSFPLPADCPAPLVLSTLGNLEFCEFGAGVVTAGLTLLGSSAICSLKKDTSIATGYVVGALIITGLAVVGCAGRITYQTS